MRSLCLVCGWLPDCLGVACGCHAAPLASGLVIRVGSHLLFSARTAGQLLGAVTCLKQSAASPNRLHFFSRSASFVMSVIVPEIRSSVHDVVRRGWRKGLSCFPCLPVGSGVARSRRASDVVEFMDKPYGKFGM
eukprot:gene12453-biopygen419